MVGGLKSIITLGGLIGGGDETASGTPPAPAPGQPAERRLTSPADRFFSAPQDQSDSSVGRMVDRVTGMVGGEQPRENEFGLPEAPVLPPVTPPGAVETAERPPGTEVPGLVPPTLETPGLDGPGLAPPQPGGADLAPPTLAAPSLETPELAPADAGGTRAWQPGHAKHRCSRHRRAGGFR